MPNKSNVMTLENIQSYGQKVTSSKANALKFLQKAGILDVNGDISSNYEALKKFNSKTAQNK